MLKKGLFFVFVLILFAMPAKVMAAPGLYTCTVLSVGVGLPNTNYPDGYITVRLSAAGGEAQFTMAVSSDTDRFYATFLTALGTGKQVSVYLDPTVPTSIEYVAVLQQ